ncbi:MAG: bifunctional hydroxymethylpyrimidine kinase/phosphomethylpyrimidine kinase [Candidatus Thermoplasmatota archaeon]
MIRVLLIGGIDPSGIAGLAADMRALSSLGINGAMVATCMVIENSRGVERTAPVAPADVRDALRAALGDGEPHAVKLGMLYGKEIARLVARELDALECPIVVDPVLTASIGMPLAEEGLEDAMVEHILPLADVVTPNAPELEALSGCRVRSYQDAEDAANHILERGGTGAVLVKGGHLRGRMATDLLVEPRKVSEFAAPRLSIARPRGLGCTYASLIAGYLALGEGLGSAVARSKDKLHASLECAEEIGEAQVINPLRIVVSEGERYRVGEEMRAALPELLLLLTPNLVPEVGVNIAYGIYGAKDFHDVCTLDSRIVLKGGRAATVGSPSFGAGSHVARTVLAVMAYDSTMRCAVNLRHSEPLLRAAKRARFSIGSFDRSAEPKGRKTMEWGTARAIEALGGIPDLIWDPGGMGKEPMARVLAQDPAALLQKVEKLSRALS